MLIASFCEATYHAFMACKVEAVALYCSPGHCVRDGQGWRSGTGGYGNTA